MESIEIEDEETLREKVLGGFYAAVSSLTIIPIYKGEGAASRTYFFISFPIIGLLFGAVGMSMVAALQQSLPLLLAWLLPLFWIILSGSTHFIGLCKTANAALCAGPPSQRMNMLTASGTAVPGVAFAMMAFLGKLCALMQSTSLDPRTLMLTVFLIPAISRYTAVIIALSEQDEDGWDSKGAKFGVFFASTAILLAAGSLSLALAVALFVGSLLTAVAVRTVVQKRLGAVPPASLGATIEISELVMLWIPAIAASAGIHLAMIPVF